MKRTVIFGGKPVELAGEAIKPGDKAPDFTVVNAKLEPVKLSDYSGKTVVISVYPSIDTGVCQAQNRRFNAEAANFKDLIVLSISCDLPFAQRRFCAAEGLDHVIALSDHRDLDFGTKYGFLMQEARLLARGTVIIDPKGIVQYVEYVPEITQEPDYEAALRHLKSSL
ncbi:MAG TPA: thiol peroxidase [Bacteroidales bacterium]|nr:thiol peroxidase [Bacteroidales bacterium]